MPCAASAMSLHDQSFAAGERAIYHVGGTADEA
jgi:hypothetical protein